MLDKFVCKKEACCGCNACVNICPKQCIELKDDIINIYAKINEKECIKCNLCYVVCQENNDSSNLIMFKNYIDCKEGFSLNENIKIKSSSGGFATALGINFIKKLDGYVVGVKNDKDKFYFDVTNDIDEVYKFSGSKYTKISMGNIFLKVKKLLIDGKNVLFFGTPCQIAAIKLFVMKPFNNLYTVDLICHGTPSTKILENYLHEKNVDTQKNLSFRKKRKNKIVFSLQNDKGSVCGKNIMDPYTIGFLKGLFYTDNCYLCKFARQDRISDITIGDSWGSKKVETPMSLIIQSTQKSYTLMSLLDEDFKVYNCDFQNAIENNKQLKTPSEKPIERELFFLEYNSKNLTKIIKKIYPKIYYKQKIKKILFFLHLK